MVREHRGGLWERLAPDVTATDLSRELTDYEERRARDRRKLESMIGYCRTARCRTRIILDYFGEEHPEDLRCGHCDNDAAQPSPEAVYAGEVYARAEAEPAPAGEEEPHELWAGEEVRHETFGEGVVLAVNGDRAEVDFSGHGTRTIRADFLSRVG